MSVFTSSLPNLALRDLGQVTNSATSSPQQKGGDNILPPGGAVVDTSSCKVHPGTPANTVSCPWEPAGPARPPWEGSHENQSSRV